MTTRAKDLERVVDFMRAAEASGLDGLEYARRNLPGFSDDQLSEAASILSARRAILAEMSAAGDRLQRELFPSGRIEVIEGDHSGEWIIHFLDHDGAALAPPFAVRGRCYAFDRGAMIAAMLGMAPPGQPNAPGASPDEGG